MSVPIDVAALGNAVTTCWDDEIVPALRDYIRVPAKSPHFDADWAAHGHIDRVVADALAWARARPIRGLAVDVVRLSGRTPVLVFDAPTTGGAGGTVLVYGHLDKQPEMTGWREGSGPWTPTIEDGKLYGRGGADDGYAMYAALAAIAALDAQGVARPRCFGLIETCEESGSYDLPPYLELLAPRMGNVDFVVALDSGAGDYERVWSTTSLRGMASGTLAVSVLDEGVHSGDASGVVPSSFRIARRLLDRLEDAATGAIRPSVFHAPIPAERVEQARAAAAILGERMLGRFPWSGATRPMVDAGAEAVLARTWRPALSVTGADGLPPIANAGNVLRPSTRLKLSLRLPPTVDGEAAQAALGRLLVDDPPHGASVRFEPDHAASGWNAPPTAPWLAEALDLASRTHFGQAPGAQGEGGTIPFMGMLGAMFPAAQYLITGVLGPKSNAHGPNEFLHIGYATRLTMCVAQALAAYAGRPA